MGINKRKNKKENAPSKNQKGKKLDKDRRCTRVAPWKDKAEFLSVYDGLFGDGKSNETKKNACKRMVIWKVRRLDLTPATILSTLNIVEVQLKDSESGQARRSDEELKMLYSSAFTRFLNYMSSLIQTKSLRTMYDTAHELGLESFLVDLRHLCAHGQDMPSVEVFRKTSEYCLDWLKRCYWDQEKDLMEDVDDSILRENEVVRFERDFREYFDVYDALNEALTKQCETIPEARKKLDKNRFRVLKTFVNNMENFKSFKKTTNLLLTKISNCVSEGYNVKDIMEMYINAFLSMDFLLKGVGEANKNKKFSSYFIYNYQEIFRQAAVYGVIEDIFYNFIDIAEDDYQDAARRIAGTYWACKILTGFIGLRKVKDHFKELKENDPSISVDTSIVNSPTLAKSVKKLYKHAGIDPKQTLIFSDVLYRPWSLAINKNYLLERLRHYSEFTADVVENCFPLIDPPITETAVNHIKNLIQIYTGQTITTEENKRSKKSSNEEIYTLVRDILGKSNENNEQQEEGKHGVWSIASDGENWSACPLGRLPWKYGTYVTT